MRPALVLAAFAAVATTSLPALADEAGDKALAAVDAAASKAKTLKVTYELSTQEADKPETTAALDMSAKGAKRLYELSGSPSLKGTKVLVEAPTAVYVFLPAFGKVRRVSSGMQDGFLGFALSIEDFVGDKLGDKYSATIDETTDTEIKLTLVKKPTATSRWAKIRMTVDKAKNLPTLLEHFDATGKLVRKDTRSLLSCESDVCSAGRRVVFDPAKRLTTVAVRKSWKVNPELSDDVFTKRNLGE